MRERREEREREIEINKNRERKCERVCEIEGKREIKERERE